MGAIRKTFAVMLIVEFFLLFFYLILVGAWADAPLQAVIDVCETAGTNPYDLGLAIFIIGSMLNIGVIVPIMVITSRRQWG